MNTSATSKTATPATNPRLRSLWNIPHLIRIPDPMPPLPELIHLFQRRIAQFKSDQEDLPSTHPNYVHESALNNISLAILEQKLADLRAIAREGFDAVARESDPIKNAPSNSQGRARPGASLHQAAENFRQDSPQSESALETERPAQNGKVNPGESKVNPGASEPNPSESAPNPSESKFSKAEPADSDREDDEEDDEGDDDEDASLEDYFDEEEIQALADFQNYLSGRSPLDKLTARQQEAIVSMFEDYTAKTIALILAEPPPRGLNLKTSEASVVRFSHRYTAAKQKAARAEKNKAAQALLDKSENPHETFQNSVERALKLRILSATDDTGLDSIDALVTTLTRLRKQALAERKQAHLENRE
jgi:hypothetical protein